MKKILLTITFIFSLCLSTFAEDVEIIKINELNKILKEMDNVSKNLYFDISPIYFNLEDKYVIAVNRQKATVTIYRYDPKTEHYSAPVKSMACTVNQSRTPLGIYKPSDKYRWHTLFGDNHYGQYCTRITGHILFHSVLYSKNKNPNSLLPSTYNALLQNSQSGGCIRLRVEDAKWIYDNCNENNTYVIIYNSDFAGPLGRPSFDKIPNNQYYDPTDNEFLIKKET